VTTSQAARPQLIRALNEQLLLGHIRALGRCSRADLARLSGLSKPTVSLALANVERSGLVRRAGHRTGVPGRSARLYEIRPEAGFVLGLDIGHQYLRGALADLTGEIRAKRSDRSRAGSVSGRIAELVGLADGLCAEAGLDRAAVTQTVIGSPGVYDPGSNAITLAGRLSGWGRPEVLAGLRSAFGPELVVENDVDAAALAEQAHGHGAGVSSFAFVSIGTGIGMGLVLDGRLHRGFHRVAGEIAFLPISEGGGLNTEDVRKRGALEAAGAASAVVRAARRAGHRPAAAGGADRPVIPFTGGSMAICETCGNDYDKAFEVRMNGQAHTFDSFECAINRLAPACEHCGNRIIGHGVEAGDLMFCCASCAAAQGAEGLRDHVAA